MAARKTSRKSVSGSPAVGEPEYLVVGFLRRSHGVKGEMLMEIYTDFPEHLQPQTKVFIGNEHQTMEISSLRSHNDGLLIRFQGVETPEEASRLRNQPVYVKSADRPPLPIGQYYQHELIGFSIVNEDRVLLGTLSDILRTGANEVYVVKRPDESEMLLPVIPSVILGIETDNRLIHVHLLPGLIDSE